MSGRSTPKSRAYAAKLRNLNHKVGADDVPSGGRDGVSHIGRKASGKLSVGNISGQFYHMSISNYSYEQDSPSPVVKEVPSNSSNRRLVKNFPQDVSHSSKQSDCLSTPGFKFEDSPSEFGKSEFTYSSAVDAASMQNAYSLLDDSGIENGPLQKERKFSAPHNETNSTESSGSSNRSLVVASFDICPEKIDTVVRLKAPLHVKNREKRNQVKSSMEGQNITILRPGMVLLKHYLSFRDQVKIVRTCRELGLGSGGFYQPGYRDGGKLHLKMMCLGKNWDPEKSVYVHQRPIDGAKPPSIPDEFFQLVEGAIRDSHAHLKKQSKSGNVEDILPCMLPDICIVNFYSNAGKLGLHQDKDESVESLHRGLPVVSFSIGDSAEFLYGDQRDTDKADKEVLESGDVLVFGGKSRHIFHGVSTILPDTAPKVLLEETSLRSGRLNLTFRQY